MIKEQEGALMSLSLKPEKKNGPITGITLWTSREKFIDFMKSEHAEKIMKSGLSDKVKSWTTDIKAELYTIEQAWHVESHD
jgi:heme-degrading monooxygenase HmoA